MAPPSSALAANRAVWAGFLVLLGAAFSLGFSCAVPLAAFAAIGALTFGGAGAYALVTAIWLANQLIGFVFLHYPLEPAVFAWGAALCVSGLIAAAAAQGAAQGIGSICRRNPALTAPAMFVAAFAAYEGTLYAVSVAAASGTANFTPAIAGRVFLINGAAFAALFLLCRAGRITGFAQLAKKIPFLHPDNRHEPARKRKLAPQAELSSGFPFGLRLPWSSSSPRMPRR